MTAPDKTAADLAGRVALTDAELGLLVGVSDDTIRRLRKQDPTFPRAVALLHPGGLARTDKGAFLRYWRARHRAAQEAKTA